MLQQHRNWYRTLAAALAASAIAPAAAGAVPAIDGGQGSAPIQGQGVAAGGGPGVTPQTLTTKSQSLAAPDNVDRKDGWTPSAADTAPTWPVNPKPIGQPATAQPSDDGGGVDTDVWIAIGGAALVAAGGIGVAGRKRLQTKRQPA